MSDVELPQVVARTQVASAIDVVVQLQRFQDGSRRVSCVSESEGVVNGSYSFIDLFRMDGHGGSLLPTGQLSTNAEQLTQQQMQHLIKLTSDIFGLAN
jgi:pilus assembly protein CpaF